ncbi:tyrosine-type recombinase/integrase [Pseudonocardia sp. T1-2H]|uniref:tyrosine-type recombinase/integrase n=1 Tax=Pseudonocardia sp. T1-2H TaxID=3128899 RepID=UPI003101AAD7
MTPLRSTEPPGTDIVIVPASEHPNRHATVLPYTEADWRISDETVARLAESVPENTRRTYTRIGRDFENWCRKENRAALPATEATLTEYVSHLIAEDAAPSRISTTIGALRKLHAVAGFKGQPDTERALQLLRGHKRQRAADGRGKKQAKPLSPEDIERMVETLDPTTFAGLRDQLILTLGYGLMARRSELAALRIADVIEVADGLEVQIRTSKTDKESEGQVRGVPPGSHVSVCPVRTHRLYRAKLAELVIIPGQLDPETPLLRSATKWGTPRRSGIPERLVDDVVKALAVAARLPDPGLYSAHSLRAGAATASLRKGVPAGIVAEHGRWSKTSPVINEYARTADLFRDNAMRGVL